MSSIQTNTAKAREAHLPVRDLVASNNIRFEADPSDVEEMKSSLLATGQLQNICAAPNTDGRISVFAGGTRLQAAAELVKEGKLPADSTLRTLIFDDIDPDSPDAIAIAMTENMVRSQMDYIDECAAMEKLAKARRTEEEIAAIFGYRPKTVAERLLIAKLIPAAHSLVRKKTRDLAWARALTIADAGTQKQICDDIASNPTAWPTGEDIRKFLLQSTISAENALFDLEEYTGEIIGDMFEGDKLSDIQQFWKLQDKAIDDLSVELEAEGYGEVVVTREPHQAWKYEDCDTPCDAQAIIEVRPNGKVEVIRGVTPVTADTGKIAALDAGDAEVTGSDLEEIAGYEVRTTPSICDYAAAQRTAMVQAEMAGDFRSALEYSVLAFLGHRGASFSAQAFSYPGRPETHAGPAFQTMADVSDAISEDTGVNVPTPDRRDVELTAMIRSMDMTTLQNLFTRLVSQRAGQQKRRGIDDSDSSLMNVFGADIDIRNWWTPDETFFELMATEDLRRLATALLPGAKATRFASSKKKDLVRALASNFRDARDGTSIHPEVAATLNSWVPGVMRFPARIDMESSEDGVFENFEEEDLDSVLFGDA